MRFDTLYYKQRQKKRYGIDRFRDRKGRDMRKQNKAKSRNIASAAVSVLIIILMVGIVMSGCGSFLFRNCHMTGSEGPGWYDATRKSKLVFERCSFGYQESAMYPGADNGERFKDCVWWEGRDAYAAG